MNRIFILALLLSVLSACSTIKTPLSYNPSFDEMSIALRTMTLTRNGKLFRDVDSDYYDEQDLNGTFDSSTPVADTLAGIGYFTGHLSQVPGTALVSDSTLGGLSLAIALLENKQAELDRLDRRIYAFIPASEVSTKVQAEDLFVDTFNTAMKSYLGGESNGFEIVRFTDHGFNGYRYATKDEIYIPGPKGTEGGFFDQNPNDKSKLLMRAALYIEPVLQVSHNPKGDRIDGFMVEANLFFRPLIKTTASSQYKDPSDYILLSRLMPDWYYQMLFINKVPMVLTSDKLNLFIKPSK